MIDNERIGRAIKTLRERAGLTQQALADRLYISKMAVSKWERGKSVPDVATLRELAIILDMDVDGLIDGTATYMDDLWRGVLMLDGAGELPAWTPLCDRPMIDCLISYFLLAGVRDILIGCNAADRAYIEGRFQGGEALGIRLRFAPPSDFGPGRLPREWGDWPAKSKVMLVTRPFFIYGVDLTRFFQRAMQRREAVVNLISVIGGLDITGHGRRGKGDIGYAYRPLPLFFYTGGQLERPAWAEESPGSVGQVWERSLCFQEPMDKGFIVSDLESAGDVDDVSTLARLIQKLCGCLLYCPPEIAWRRGMIDYDQMLKCAECFPEYGAYLTTL